MSLQNEPVAIIGTGCRLPGECSTASKFFQLLKSPVDLQTEIPLDRFNAQNFYHPDGSHHGTSNVLHSYLLSEQYKFFDAQFFGFKVAEAQALDPQQRLILETVYEAFESAGLDVAKLRGSNTGCFVGSMTQDYGDLLAADVDLSPMYQPTGCARSILSNRISYCFDLKGPSMTIDTACSSSLVALHLAVQSLRSGESSLSIVAGSNIILNPYLYITESKLKMLSPTGRSRMWDRDADGYARGEGVVSVVVKLLKDALADGDPIECIVRETGLNQDGATTGITMPSGKAQAELIRKTYHKAGLDLDKSSDRPQFFEAHGTGTPAGDPQEAEAISRAFFEGRENNHPDLLVGSVKTIVGHTEGTAGLTSVLKMCKSLQEKTFLPNLLFDNLNPAITPFYSHLEVSTQTSAWPEPLDGGLRRASVNSFGFGGANSHAILEEYRPPYTNGQRTNGFSPSKACFVPFVFSASSETTLRRILSGYSSHLSMTSDIDPQNLAFTLSSKRSAFAHRTYFAAESLDDLQVQLSRQSEDQTLSFPKVGPKKGGTIGIFTGQGAQWAGMGKQLVLKSTFAMEFLKRLEKRLSQLGDDSPQWSLTDELLKDTASSRIGEAAFSQPLCTAIQLLLIAMLRASNINLTAVVGHSSGEIAAAYASGVIPTPEDAICIAYLRGKYTKFSGGTLDGPKGAMMAVGSNAEDIQELLSLEEFEGRVSIAAFNSPQSLTLSGDLDAVEELRGILEEEGKFARLLKVDQAYHSFHMNPCAKPYLDALGRAGIRTYTTSHSDTLWLSSTTSRTAMNTKEVSPSYWIENMIQPVLFHQALEFALETTGPFANAIEIGPHPTLRSPFEETLKALNHSIPYFGTLRRNTDDVCAFGGLLGNLWASFEDYKVDLKAYDALMSPGQTRRSVDKLPTYPWDRSRSFWWDSRMSRLSRQRKHPPHSLLGTKMDEGAEREHRWRNILSLKELPWLNGHKLQSQPVLPGAFYIVCAIEAAMQLPQVKSRQIKLIEVEDIKIASALVFNEDDETGFETIFSLTEILDDGKTLTGQAKFFSAATAESDELQTNMTGRLVVTFDQPDPDVLPPRSFNDHNLKDVNSEAFYKFLHSLGYHYSGPFKTLSSIRRRLDFTTAVLPAYREASQDSLALVHPATLDTLFQSVFAAYCFPNDGRLSKLVVPIGIRRVSIDPHHWTKGDELSQNLYTEADSRQGIHQSLTGSVQVSWSEGGPTVLHIEDLLVRPFADPTEADDRQFFFEKRWGPADLDLDAAVQDYAETPEGLAFAEAVERISFYYVRKIEKEMSGYNGTLAEPHHHSMMNWVRHNVSRADDGLHEYVQRGWLEDEEHDIRDLIKKYETTVDVRMLRAVGDHLPRVMKGELGHILEYMRVDGLLDDYYAKAIGLDVGKYAAPLLHQLSFRYPQLTILEIGAGTGGSTVPILDALGPSFGGTYTFTDISSGFFEQAQNKFSDQSSKMIFKVLNVENDPLGQGFQASSYDVVVAAFVVHATSNLEAAMRNVRRLLKPGGYFILIEATNPDIVRPGFIFGALPGWWLGAEDGRTLSPLVDVDKWDGICKKTGFDRAKPVLPMSRSLLNTSNVLICRAIDPKTESILYPLAKVPADLIPQLYLVGGQSIHAVAVHSGIKQQMQQVCGSITEFRNLEALLDLPEMDHSAYVLSVVELDTPLFQDMNSERLRALKKLFTSSKCLLWVFCSSHFQSPYTAMTIPLSSAVASEYPRTAFSILDLERLDISQVSPICETMMRLGVSPDSSSLWTSEYELATKNGALSIPRFVPDYERNARYNSRHRSVGKKASLDAVLCVEIQNIQCTVSELPYWQFTQDTTKNLLSSDPRNDSTAITLKYSSLRAIRVANTGYHYVAIGHDNSGQAVAIFTSILRSKLHVNRSALVQLDRQEVFRDDFAFLFHYLMAKAIVHAAGEDCNIVLLDAPESVIATIHHLAEAEGLSLTILTTREDQARSVWRPTIVHPRETHEVIVELIPDHTALFVAFSSETVNEHFRKALKSSVEFWDPSNLFGLPTPTRSPIRSGVKLLNVLRDSLDIPRAKTLFANSTELLDFLNISSLQGHTLETTKMEILDWSTKEEATVQILPVTSGAQLFSASKTYWLIGLTGDLGQSLCVWMIENGARHVVLSSRNPRVEKKWREHVEKMGAHVYIWSNDITNLEDVRSLIHRIDESLPPLSGVAQGAMVLNDALFSKMTFEQYENATRPKVQGSLNLETVLKDRPLDFMIYFSSLASLRYGVGQPNYALANAFLSGLAQDRRRRGLAGSVIIITAILGCGYVTREVTEETQARYIGEGVNVMSETDFHTLFAEACIHTLDSGVKTEVATGIRTYDPSSGVLSNWHTDPRLSHFITAKSISEVSNGTSAGGESLQTRLLSVLTEDDALIYLRLAFAIKLRKLLQLQEDVDKLQVTLCSYGLVELGVDSLVAVGIRSWFWKELEVDIPLLQILGGGTFSKIIAAAVIALPQKLTPLWSKENVPEVSVLVERLSKLPIIPTQVQPSTTVQKGNGNTAPPGHHDVESSKTSPASASIDVNGVNVTTAGRNAAPAEMRRTDSGIVDVNGQNGIQAQDADLRPKQSRRGKILPLSPAQEGFWQNLTMFPDRPDLNNTTMRFDLHGPLDITRLSAAVKTIGRHAALRTRFYVDKNQGSVQEILPISSVALDVKMSANQSMVDEQFSELHAHNYDLGAGESMKILLLVSGPEDYSIVCGFNHITFDSDSLAILLQEVNKVYAGISLPALGLDYDDYLQLQALSMSGPAYQKDMSFWTAELTGSPLPPILPPNKYTERPNLRHPSERQYFYAIPETLMQQILSKCRVAGSTSFHFYVSCVAKLIHRTTDSTDFTITILDRNRNPETESLFGLLRNELPLRFRNFNSEPNATISQARDKVYQALEHGSVPGEMLERRFELKPLCMVNMPWLPSKDTKFCGAELKNIHFETSWGMHAFQLVILDGGGNDGTTLQLRVQAELFDEKEGKWLMDTLVGIVEKSAGDE